MCLPEHNRQYNRGCNRRTLLMAGLGLGLGAIVLIVVIIALVAKSNGDACMENLQCLPLNECDGHTNPDFAYGCGNDDEFSKICCIAKKKINESTRLLKRDLLPFNNCGVGDTEDRIGNGKNASIGQFPWMAVLLYNQPGLDFLQALCGGTLINERYILTAAHCIYFEENPSLELSHVRLGELDLDTPKDCSTYSNGDKDCSPDPVEVKIQYIIEHEKYNKTSLKNDIALLRLETPVNITGDFIKPICLPYGIPFDETLFMKEDFTLSGWGKINPSSVGIHSLLQYTSVKLWDKESCEKELVAPQLPLESSQVCASGPNIQEACKGDSGGPMSYIFRNGTKLRAVQIGITSFKSVDTCAVQRVPTIFTRVHSYLDWILDHLEK